MLCRKRNSRIPAATNPLARIWAKKANRSRFNLLAIRPCVVKRHGSLTGRSNCEVERYAGCEVRTASFAYKSKVVSNSLNKREDHFTGFRVVKRFVGDILDARCLSYSRARTVT